MSILRTGSPNANDHRRAFQADAEARYTIIGESCKTIA
jgi:hypothetical protein